MSSNAYKAADFVHVVDGISGEVQAHPVPKSWLGTDLLSPGTKKATAKQISDSDVEVVEAKDATVGPFGTPVATVADESDAGSGDDDAAKK